MSARSNQLKERLGLGVWVDEDNTLHFSVPELLELFELADTEENRQIALQNITKVLQREIPLAQIIVRETE